MDPWHGSALCSGLAAGVGSSVLKNRCVVQEVAHRSRLPQRWCASVDAFLRAGALQVLLETKRIGKDLDAQDAILWEGEGVGANGAKILDEEWLALP